LYIAQIILRKADRIAIKMAAIPTVYDSILDDDNDIPAAVAIEKKYSG
jgi:hypothetical protein